MYILIALDIKKRALKIEKGLILKELATYDKDGSNWQTVNRNIKIKLLKRLNKVHRRYKRISSINRCITNIFTKLDLVTN